MPTMVLGLTKLNLTFGSFELHLDCLECTSPGFQALQATMRDASAVQQVTGMVNAALARASQQVRGSEHEAWLWVCCAQNQADVT